MGQTGKVKEVIDRVNYIFEYKLVLLFLVFTFIALLYPLSGSDRDFVLALTRILIMLGILLMFPYISGKMYLSATDADPSFILNGLQGGLSQDLIGPMRQMLFPLVLLSMFPYYIVVIGFILVVLGIAIRIYAKKAIKKQES